MGLGSPFFGWVSTFSATGMYFWPELSFLFSLLFTLKARLQIPPVTIDRESLPGASESSLTGREARLSRGG
jgi:hypothetical protein